MSRKSPLAVAVALVLGPGVGWALSLGSIETHSALNQRFEAVIPVQDLDPEDLDGLKVSIASPRDFARAGLDRPYLLQALRFIPTVTPDGRPVIRVTSKGPIREPFLDFLVEVVWPKGRLLKEYTVLLDPPLTTGRKAPPIAAARTAPARPTSTAPAAAKASAAAVAGTAPAGVYGPVRRGETLWGIAKGLGVQGATTSQVALALYRENPDAFLKGDINRLRVGARLRVPASQDILATPPRRARREFMNAANPSHGRRAAGPRHAKPTPPAPKEALRIVTPEPKSAQTSAAIEQVKSDLMMVREAGESTRQETEELRGRIRELETQLADIRRLLALKNDQLAQLAAGAGAKVQGTPSQAATEAAPTEAAPVKAEQVPSGPPEAVAQAPAVSQPSPSGVVSPAASSVPRSQPSPAQPKPAVVPPVPAAKAPPPPPPEPGFFDRLLSDPTLLGIFGAVVVVMLALSWLMIRRRREAEAKLQESLLIHPDDLPVGGAKGEPEPVTGQTPDNTSFMSDFTPSDIDALREETGEVDPASEADVYIAYGRYQQAETLISQALEKQPERVDLKLKLLEIYFTTRNTAAFVKLAEEMEAQGAAQKDPEAWKKVKEMGRELLPSHRLFGGDGNVALAAAAAAGAAAAANVGSDTSQLPSTLDIDTEISEPPNVGEELSQAALDEGTELAPPGLREGATEGLAKAGEKVHEEEEIPSSELNIDLEDLASLDDIDLGDIDLDKLSEPGDLSVPSEPGIVSAGREEGPASASVAAADEVSSEIPDIDLSELEMEGGEVIPEADLGSLSDLLQPVSEQLKESPPHPSATTDSSSLSADQEPASQEEVETKLDLARAYMEMGDTEGAKEILGEVLEEGDERQRDQAKDLMNGLG